MSKKVCEICGIHPATVPDRDRPGRLINRVCSRCHQARLVGDVNLIMKLRDEKIAAREAERQAMDAAMNGEEK